MPRASHYEGMTLSDKLREFAEFHGRKKTRHITIAEVKFLRDAADLIEQLSAN